MPLDPAIWNKEIPIPESAIKYVDKGVREKLPSGTEVTGISPSGESYWARLAKIDAVNENGQDTPYFIKVHQGDVGKNIVSSEYKAMCLFHEVMPELTAKPIAWGAYEEMSETYFFLSQFVKMSNDIPSKADFPALVAELHKRSRSPDGKYGFPHVMHIGIKPIPAPPSDTWESCFTQMLQSIFDSEGITQGHDEEIVGLKSAIMTKVVPRLIRPLETEGRKVIPSLVHGDLWDGNASVDVNTGRPILFDPLALYGHNEYELAPWRAPRHKMTKEYIDQYVNNAQISEPTEDFDDRLMLYMLKFDMISSNAYPGNPYFRDICRETMKTLVAKFPLGYPGYLNERAAARNAEIAVPAPDFFPEPKETDFVKPPDVATATVGDGPALAKPLEVVTPEAV